jgi:hypothetical protein
MEKEDFTLSEGQVKFTFDPKTGTYVKTASVPKTYAPEKAGTSSDSNVFKFDTAAKESLLMAGLGGNDMQTIENALNVASPEVVLKNLEAQVKAGAISQAVFDKVSGMIQPKPFNEEGFMSNSFITGLIDEAAVKQDRWNSFESTVKAEIVQKVKDYAAYLKQNNYSPSQIQTELTSYIQNLIK